MLRPSFVFGLLALTLFLGQPALADVVHLKDGRRLLGSVSKEGSTLVVRQRYGEVRVPEREVLRIEDSQDAWDELKRRRSSLAFGTADERYRYAVLARKHGFDEEARQGFLSVLRVDIDHPGARGALGYVHHQGRWLTIEDKNRLDGLVEYRGEWVTPEVKAKREEELRERVLAKKRAREEAKERKVAERKAKKERQREARRERIQAYERALARERARREVEAEYDVPQLGIGSGSRYYGPAIINGVYYPAGGYSSGAYPYTPYPLRVNSPYPQRTIYPGRTYRSGNYSSSGCYSAPYRYRSYGTRSSSGYRSGVSGSYKSDNGSWSLRWRFGR